MKSSLLDGIHGGRRSPPKGAELAKRAVKARSVAAPMGRLALRVYLGLLTCWKFVGNGGQAPATGSDFPQCVCTDAANGSGEHSMLGYLMISTGTKHVMFVSTRKFEALV